ncbi:MAG TPA: substrate-binding domain-containing protein [Solirubrobacterales bacterium]|nr:substrate-binding domain-containing protein [Solirubrobacterales bacterium]
MALAVAGLAPQANAAFTTGKCAGTEITGRGASFARDAHNAFITNFGPFYCGKPAPTVTYEALGSGEGRTAVKARELAPRFGMSDEPPVPSEVSQMNAGGSLNGEKKFVQDSDPSNDGLIHVVPAAVGAVAPLVNFPDGCDASKLPEASKTSTDAKLLRVRFTKDQWEKVWAQNGGGEGVLGDPAPYVTWRDVFGTLDDNTACKMPIVRVVRKDDSGTTFAFKDHLNALEPAREWLSKYAATSGNKTLEWPGATFGDRDDCGDKDGIAEASDPDGPGSPGLVTDTDNLTSACSNNAENLTQKLIDTDGSVGYADISTARSKGLAVNPAGGDVDTYWTQLENGSNTFVEPTFSATGYQTTGSKGANCQATEFKNQPATTLGDWSKVSGVDAPAGWGLCTITYGLVFDDNADVWGNTPAEEAKARTVKDYWENVLSTTAQAALFPNDYAPLPAEVLSKSKAGIAAVDWNKGEGGGGKEEEIKDPLPPNKGGGNPLPVKPSNVFSLLRKSITSKTGGATVSVKLPGAGTLELLATAKKGKKSIKVGRTVLNATQAGTYNLTLKPNAVAMKALKEKGKLPVRLELTFTPTGGDESDSTSSLTLKLTQKKGK